jgi:hypothetical protein
VPKRLAELARAAAEKVPGATGANRKPGPASRLALVGNNSPKSEAGADIQARNAGLPTASNILGVLVGSRRPVLRRP